MGNPQPPQDAVAWVEGKNLAIRSEVKLPKVCLKCGATSNVRKSSRTLIWVPADKRRNRIFWSTMFGPLGGAIAGAAEARHQRSVTLELPICGRCEVGWRNSRIYLLMAVGVWILLMIYLVTARAWLGPWISLGMFFGGLIALLIAARRLNRNWLVRAERIETDHAVLGDVHPSVRDAIVARLSKRKGKRTAGGDE